VGDGCRWANGSQAHCHTRRKRELHYSKKTVTIVVYENDNLSFVCDHEHDVVSARVRKDKEGRQKLKKIFGEHWVESCTYQSTASCLGRFAHDTASFSWRTHAETEGRTRGTVDHACVLSHGRTGTGNRVLRPTMDVGARLPRISSLRRAGLAQVHPSKGWYHQSSCCDGCRHDGDPAHRATKGLDRGIGVWVFCCALVTDRGA
jgi:hypothetical protein